MGKNGKVRGFLGKNIVPLLFACFCAVGVYYSGTGIPTILSDLVNRFDRNALLVLSLILPVISGMGLNFGIVLGAMSGQVGLILVSIWKIQGLPAILIAMLIAMVVASFCGFLAGKMLNRTKGQEMITSMILGFFANGIYQFIFLFIAGGVIKFSSDLLLSSGIGIKNTIALDSMQYALDDMKIFGVSTKVDLFTAMMFFGALFLLYYLFRVLVKKNREKKYRIRLGISAALIVAGAVGYNLPALVMYKMMVRVPIPTYLIIIGACILIQAFMKTKLGQDMRAVGHDRKVAASAGIRVDKVRIQAIILSTVIAALGQIIFYQNLGTMDTYYGHEKVGTYCVAAILIGGASVQKATIGQAILGALLFHLLFNVSPLAAQNMFSNSMVGGYFRMVACYGIIAVALILHAWRSRVDRKKKSEEV